MRTQPSGRIEPRDPQQRTGDSTVIERIANASPRFKARMAGGFYLLNIVTGSLAAVFAGGTLAVYGDAANLLATASYVVVTLILYYIFEPVNRSISLLAAFFSLAGCTIGALNQFDLVSSPVSPLVFFGFYCLLSGYLIFRSTFLPKNLGVLMAIGGLGWMTFLWPTLSDYLFPYNLAPGIIGETALTLWLIVKGVNVQRWKEQATNDGKSRLPNSGVVING